MSQSDRCVAPGLQRRRCRCWWWCLRHVVPYNVPPCAVGRTGFYDEYGIIRDVLQNHLTEMVTLLVRSGYCLLWDSSITSFLRLC